MKETPYAWRIASRNINRNWKRSLAAILSISAGFIALNLFEGYIADAESIFDITYSQRLMLGDVLIHHEDAFQSGMWDDGTHLMDLNTQTQLQSILKQTGDVDNSVEFLNVSGQVSNGSANSVFSGYGYEVEAGRKMREPAWEWNTLAGAPLGSTPTDADSGVLGQTLGRVLDCLPEHRLNSLQPKGGYEPFVRPFHCRESSLLLSVMTANGQANATSLEVRGLVDAVYSEADSRFLAMPLAKAQSLLGTDGISLLSVRLTHPSEIGGFLGKIRNAFRQANLKLKATRWQNHPYGDIYVRSLSFLRVFRLFTLAVVLTVVTLSVFSTVLRLVQERTPEIGTLRSLGFRNLQVLGFFMLESSLLALFGTTLGIFASYVISFIVNSIGIYYKIGILSEEIPLHILLPPGNFLTSAVILIALSLLATLIATRRALRSTIPDCLAHH